MVLIPSLAGVAFAGGVDCDSAFGAVGVVLNELVADPEGTDPGRQWIEVYNESGLDLDASGWRIEAGAAGYDTSSTLPVGTFLIDGESIVIAQSALPFADLVRPGFVLGPATLDADAVRLTDCGGNPVDTVVYGASNADGWLDDSGNVAASLAPAPASGQPLARLPDGDDTDASGVDFQLVTTPTPGSPNDAPPQHCGGPGSGVLVNEVYDDGAIAWIELLHTGAAPALLEGWSIAFGATGMSPAYTFAAGQVASPGARFVVGDAPEASYPADLSLAGITAVRVVDCLGSGSDTLVIGPVNAMGWVDDGGTAAVGLAPPLTADSSLSRLPDGVDTNDAAADFVLAAPTPAAENGTADPPDPPDDTDTPPVPTDTDTDADLPPGDDDDVPPPVPPTEDDGCSCATPSATPPWIVLVLCAAAFATGRRSARRC